MSRTASGAQGAWTFRHALGVFLRHTSPRILVLAVLATVPLRLWLGGWTASDAIIPAVIVAVHPLTEWVIHVGLLHWRPRKLGPVTLDFIASRDHRAHHADPEHLPLVFIPIPTLLVALALLPAAWFLLAPTPQLALTGLATISVVALLYEWTHFVCHVPWSPRTAFMRQRIKHHRLHHYKNERYWYGVTLHLGDALLRTRPDPASVPRSPTARALHSEA